MSASPLDPLVEKLESIEALDAPGKALGERVRGTIGPGPLKDAISGTWMGHALHPLLTDVTIGAFLSASILDALGGDRDGSASERLIAVGIASYAPTALTGTSDWADSEPVDDSIRRVGLLHAAVNATGLMLYAASLRSRRKGRRGRGKLLGFAGASALGAGGYLGGHLAFVQGVGPNQTAYDSAPEDWTEAIGSDELEDGKLASAVVGDTPVLLVRHADGIHALHDRCSHRGCLLSDGELDGETIECTCHGSRFSLRDGAIERGPATVAQPAYEARERDGRIEIRPAG